ncbi:molecular chaperone HtpG [Calycomorphotria hydatis]|uniref:Chaperone protein HtpG n=1 Tax=Calycomorphotria hydatis TaxID=2528027 RepID=A0A517T590_9PLAN|nr:molecular chaperone HtpG [Calycomorphotria hydatis]QDT63546.1 Chaperone protein HtpG [Calycomorphotria hydatis]
MSTETAPVEEQIPFQAEVSRLLHLLSHSLYQNREVAIRELVSNASDALDKYRHLSLTDESVRDDAPLKINITIDEEAKTLTIADNGVGMSREELIENLGTIAHSGSLDFLSKLSGDEAKDVSLIGQFGVGFYAAFMLADKVEVTSRSCRDAADTGNLWTSDGTGAFQIQPIERETPHGTSIALHMREDAKEFLSPDRLKFVLNKYSTFVPHTIELNGEHANEQTPIWVEPKSQVSEEQYEKFYQFLSHRSDEKPSWHLHLTADSPFQFHAILYAPESNYEKLGFGKSEHGLSLCAKRVLVQHDCKELLPEYLRFLYGLVDSADLPLNVSRQALQDDSVFRKIRKVLVKKVLDHLTKMAKDDTEKYNEFWKEFGTVLREGIASDYENRDKLAGLLRYYSSHDEGQSLVSLQDYLDRADDSQEQIFFLSGSSVAAIQNNPNLEVFKSRGLEVLFLIDPIDEFVFGHLNQFQGKRLVSIDSAEVKLPGDEKADESESEQEEDKPAETTEDAPTGGMKTVVDAVKEILGDEVQDVRTTSLLVDSPCRLVTPEGALSAQMQQLLNATGQNIPASKKILELNPKHPLVERLSILAGNEQNLPFIKDCGQQLYANALILTGLAPDPGSLIQRTERFMNDLAEKRTSIVL